MIEDHYVSKGLFRLTRALAYSACASLLLATNAVAMPSSGSHEEQDSPNSAESPAMEELESGEGFMGASQPASASNEASSRTAKIPLGVMGVDVSHHQGAVAWSALWAEGKRFSYVKATEGDGYRDPLFTQQYAGARSAGMYTGGYHFARPDLSGGKAQADHFVDNGGGWNADGRTLPGVLDVEGPYFDTKMNLCWDMTPSQILRWIDDFLNRYKQRTGRAAVIYTNPNWWTTCTGNSSKYSTSNPLWLARYSSEIGTLPGQWAKHTFWQYSDQKGIANPIDQNVFHGTLVQLRSFATSAGPFEHVSPVCPAGPAYTTITPGTLCDIPANHKFNREINWLISKGITTGYTDGSFRPRNQITREAMAAFLYRYSGSPRVSLPSRSPFKDVAPGHPFYKEIVWLADQGFTTGYDDGTFKPRRQITREAMAAFLYRFADEPPAPGKATSFADVPKKHTFFKEITWLAATQITTGYDDGKFKPRRQITREATAAFIYRLDQLPT